MLYHRGTGRLGIVISPTRCIGVSMGATHSSRLPPSPPDVLGASIPASVAARRLIVRYVDHHAAGANRGSDDANIHLYCLIWGIPAFGFQIRRKTIMFRARKLRLFFFWLLLVSRPRRSPGRSRRSFLPPTYLTPRAALPWTTRATPTSLEGAGTTPSRSRRRGSSP